MILKKLVAFGIFCEYSPLFSKFVNTRNDSSIYLAFVVWFIALGKKVINKEAIIFSELFQLMNEERKIKFEYHRFANTNELMDLNDDH